MKIIEICGNLCSGKTTLSRILEIGLSYKYIHADLDNALIESFFKNPGKYFLQQQLSFLLNKAMQIHSCIINNENMIVDRSLYEDVNIFASYFIKNKKRLNISQSDIDAYLYIANKILNEMPTSDIAIYCNTSPKTCNNRLVTRTNSSYEKLYPQNHIDNLDIEYDNKISNISCKTLITFNGDNFNLNDKTTQTEITHEINELLNDQTQTIVHTKYFTVIKSERLNK